MTNELDMIQLAAWLVEYATGPAASESPKGAERWTARRDEFRTRLAHMFDVDETKGCWFVRKDAVVLAARVGDPIPSWCVAGMWKDVSGGYRVNRPDGDIEAFEGDWVVLRLDHHYPELLPSSEFQELYTALPTNTKP